MPALSLSATPSTLSFILILSCVLTAPAWVFKDTLSQIVSISACIIFYIEDCKILGLIACSSKIAPFSKIGKRVGRRNTTGLLVFSRALIITNNCLEIVSRKLPSLSLPRSFGPY